MCGGDCISSIFFCGNVFTCLCLFLGIENEDNWHGKALGDKADKIVQTLSDSIKGSKPVTIVPEAPKGELQPVTHGKIVLSDKPEYELGKQVRWKRASYREY